MYSSKQTKKPSQFSGIEDGDLELNTSEDEDNYISSQIVEIVKQTQENLFKKPANPVTASQAYSNRSTQSEASTTQDDLDSLFGKDDDDDKVEKAANSQKSQSQSLNKTSQVSTLFNRLKELILKVPFSKKRY